MPPSPDRSNKKPRKSKPKFELPAETETQNAPVGWVFRDKEEALGTVIPIDSAAMPGLGAEKSAHTDPPVVKERNHAHPVLIAGAGIFLIGVSAVGVTSLIAMAIAATPIRLAKGWFRRAG